MHQQVLQYQYLRAQQEAITVGSRLPYHVALDPKLEAACVEGTQSPPLELRRGRRTPQERTTDSPQIAQVYMMHGAGRYNATNAVQRGYYEPPPAHLQRAQYPLPASEAPPERALTPDRSRKQLVTSPPQGDSLLMMLQRYPVMWQGLLALKNDQAAVQMHFVFGNPNVARESLPCNSDGSTPPLRIAQRMRLEPTQVEGVARKMQVRHKKFRDYNKIFMLIPFSLATLQILFFYRLIMNTVCCWLFLAGAITWMSYSKARTFKRALSLIYNRNKLQESLILRLRALNRFVTIR